MTNTEKDAEGSKGKDLIASLDELFKAVNRTDSPGLVVGVAHQSKTIYRRGFGMASIEHGTANTPATRMRIGSVTKHICCLAILLLAEDGKLDIDAPASQYLPELPVWQGVPTLRQFMNHTSGYRCYVDLATIAGGMAIQPAGTALAAQLRQTGVNFAPGERQIYCNGTFHLLSIVIERVSGMSFEEFLRSRIFEPLGMTGTASIPSDMEIHQGMATYHVARPRPDGTIAWRRGIFASEELRGEGAIVSTVDDMLIWLKQVRGERRVVGTDATWQLMTTTATLNNGRSTPYAMGLFREPYRGLDLIYHHGAVMGGMCQMLTVPSHALDIIVITNGALVNHIELTKRIIDLVLADEVSGDPAAVMADSKRFEHLLGSQYYHESGLVLGLDDVGGKLGGSMNFSPAAPVWRDEGDTLRVAFEDIGIGPFEVDVADLEASADGSVMDMLKFRDGGNVMLARRLPTVPPSTSEVGSTLVGRYHSRDLDADAVIAFEGDNLVLRMAGSYGARVVDLVAASDSVFRMAFRDPMLPLTSALTVLRENDKTVGFHFGTGRSRGIRFDRISDVTKTPA